MEKFIIEKIQNKTNFSFKQIEAVINLLNDNNTIPFIARYRKEATNNLDEVEIKTISDSYDYLLKLNTRKNEIIKSLENLNKLDDNLLSKLNKAEIISELEDIYRPFRPKRKTLASIAKDNGLEPLALLILNQDLNLDISTEAKKYIKEDLDLEAVLKGVHEILAEYYGDLSELRAFFRKYIYNNGIIKTKLKEEDLDQSKTYQMYYDYSEKVSNIVSHRILALNRAEKEKVITVSIEVDEDEVFNILDKRFVINQKSEAISYIVNAYKDAFKRFIKPAIEREIRNDISEKAELSAVEVFSENLYNLLLTRPIKDKVIMGFDPAFRSGCKLAIINENGEVLNISIIYPHTKNQEEKASQNFIDLINKYNVDLIALGNGTASRESERFIAENLKKIKREVYYLIVSEAGASVYSASEIARSEFPNLSVEERSAISIARRVLDPLAELIKVDPKAIGVGQYQHDIAPKVLDDNLSFVVERAVNEIGVDLNSASSKLLEYISGLNKTSANNIIKYRSENKRFTNRKQLLEVSRLGDKSYQQAIGFLRIYNGDNILDSTNIHPESYKLTKQIISDYNIDINNLGSDKNNEILNSLNIKDLSNKYNTGIETLTDIINILIKPHKDQRDTQKPLELKSDILNIEDLKIGLKLNGTVRNVVDFGVFVDIGLDNDGLVHISKISNKFIKHPSEVLKVGDQISVTVIEYDAKTNRISLSLID